MKLTLAQVLQGFQKELNTAKGTCNFIFALVTSTIKEVGELRERIEKLEEEKEK